MITPVPQPTSCAAHDQVRAGFLLLLPRLRTHAAIAFRHIRCPETKADLISETIGIGWKWMIRLAERGLNINQFPMAFIVLAARAVRSGRRTCRQESARDAFSPIAQQRHGFRVESLPSSTRAAQERLYGEPHGQKMQDVFEERLRDDSLTPVPEQVSFRIDWPEYFNSLSNRDRELAVYLLLGNSATEAARKFAISPGRVTQLRQRWHREWQSRQANETARA
jgi:hypothetical protein